MRREEREVSASSKKEEKKNSFPPLLLLLLLTWMPYPPAFPRFSPLATYASISDSGSSANRTSVVSEKDEDFSFSFSVSFSFSPPPRPRRRRGSRTSATPVLTLCSLPESLRSISFPWSPPSVSEGFSRIRESTSTTVSAAMMRTLFEEVSPPPFSASASSCSRSFATAAATSLALAAAVALA